jgi:tetratricopeptide (TPR) repeat protein
MVGFSMRQLRVDPEGALELYDRSLALHANCTQALALRGWALATAGRHDEAIGSLWQALRLSPFGPETFFTMSAMGCARLMARRFADAIKWTSRALRERPNFAPALRFQAVCLVELGRMGEARDTVSQLLQLEPGLRVSTLRQRAPIFDPELMNAFFGWPSQGGLAGVSVDFSSGMEVAMTYESRCLAGILLVLLPTVMFGGVSILSLLIGDPTYMQNPLRQDLWRAGTRMPASGSSWR